MMFRVRVRVSYVVHKVLIFGDYDAGTVHASTQSF